MAASSWKSISPRPHHQQNELCNARPRYRQGRKQTAVKVYTINLESHYLLVMGVPAVGAKDELEAKCSEFGDVARFHVLDEYPAEEFTEVYLVCFTRLQSARFAKQKLDGNSFFGGVLHVCFAPEFETVEETRSKLIERQKYVSICTKSGFTGPWAVRRSRPHDMPSTAAASGQGTSAQSTPDNTYVWAGKTYTIPQPDGAAREEPTERRAVDVLKPKAVPFLPRQVRKQQQQQQPERSMPRGDGDDHNDAYATTSDEIRNALSRLSAPNLKVSLKRRKT